MKHLALSGAVFSAILYCTSVPSVADPVGPELAAASNFGQGARQDYLAAGRSLPVLDFRDAVYWDDVDQDGRFVFTTPSTRYPALLASWGAGMSLTVNNGHPDYDGGTTPLSPAAVQRFGRHAAELVQRFPNIHSVEVGNEFNSANFVSGPLRDAGLAARADAYVALLASVSSQVKAVRPEVKILGGGVHSIPTGFLAAQIDRGAAAWMDAIVLHPYDTPVEMLLRQIEVMRRIPELADIPVEITEFGSQDPDLAPSYLLRSYCQMALSGVTRAAWYAINPRGDGYVPLFDASAKLTPTGRTFDFVASKLAGQPVQAYRPDPFTYGCLFGDHTLILWGEPRAVQITRADLSVQNAVGDAVENPHLSMDQALLITGTQIVPSTDIQLGPQNLLADSYHQFGYPEPGQADPTGDPFERFGRFGDRELILATQDGQGREGVPWVPYRGTDWDKGLRLLSQQMLPSDGADFPVEIVHRYTSPVAQTVDLLLNVDPVPRSEDGILLTVSSDGAQLIHQVISQATETQLQRLELVAGQTVEISIGPNGNARGDVTDYRFQVLQAR